MRTVATLVAGRGAYRVAQQASEVTLLALWGAAGFAPYAAATGISAWLFALTASGVEKAALTLIPRGDGPGLERFFHRLAFAPLTVCVAGWLVGVAVEPGGAVARYAAAATLSTGIGCCAVQVALFRLRGRPHADAAAYTVIAATYGCGALLVATTGVRAATLLAFLAGTVTVLNVVLALLLRPPGPRLAAGAWPAARAAAVLTVGEALAIASVSILYAELTARSTPAQVSRFYLLVLGPVACGVLWGYLLRIWQPRTVAWLRAHGPAAGVGLARRVLRWLLPPAALATGALVAWPHPAGIGVEIALSAGCQLCVYLMENLDARRRRASAGTAVAQCATVAAVGWALVPSAGAVGGIVALAAGYVAQGGALWLLLRRTPTCPPDEHSSTAPESDNACVATPIHESPQ
ncbi:hypothetical protein R8Z50_18165 [Longispora sp. K20-0274]|uniref:hypothetical protein n=1 Tax=Longispora sp. K20-0274 TaxID=3088255 RepID=UPI00399B0792